MGSRTITTKYRLSLMIWVKQFPLYDSEEEARKVAQKLKISPEHVMIVPEEIEGA